MPAFVWAHVLGVLANSASTHSATSFGKSRDDGRNLLRKMGFTNGMWFQDNTIRGD
jgi:hypothetical protein